MTTITSADTTMEFGESLATTPTETALPNITTTTAMATTTAASTNTPQTTTVRHSYGYSYRGSITVDHGTETASANSRA